MAESFLREYGVATTINFELASDANPEDLEAAAAFVAGDVVLMSDEGTEANTTNLPADEGTGYSLALTAAEMQAARLMVYLIDQTGTKVWMDKAIRIETYGDASAQHAVNLNDSVRAGLTALPNAAAEAAGGLYTRGSGAGQLSQSANGALGVVSVNTDMRGTDNALLASSNGSGLTEAGGTGDHLTAIPWNSAWDAEVQSEVQDALEVNHLDHLLAVTYDPAAQPGVADALLNELIENDSGVSRFTANALEQGPSGGGGTSDWTAGEREEIRGRLGITGTTAAGGNTPTLALEATVAALNDLSAADVNAQVDLALNTAIPGSPTANSINERIATLDDAYTAVRGALLDNLDVAVSGRSSHSAADVWAEATRTLTAAPDESAAQRNAMADHVWRRTAANIRASSDGDTATFRSGLGAMSKLVNRVAVNGSNLEIYQENDTTVFGTQAITTNASADPITELNTS